MDYHPKMIVPNSKIFLRHEEEDDEDLETLRMAALKSVKTKTSPPIATAPATHQIHLNFPSFGNHRYNRDFHYPSRRPWMNGNVYYPSRSNQNLIEIIPVEENTPNNDVNAKSTESNSVPATPDEEQSKFHRYDHASCSDEEDKKESVKINSEKIETEEVDAEIEIPQSASGETSPQPNPEASATEERAEPIEKEESLVEENGDVDDDDEDVLLMTDFEEEDSMDRIINEMERERMEAEKLAEKKEPKLPQKESKESRRPRESSKTHASKRDRVDNKNDNVSLSYKTNARSDSPNATNRVINSQKSLCPKAKLRTRSSRRSPRRSPSRHHKKSLGRLRSPGRYSPKSSPRRSPARRSPMWKFSPRERSPHSRTPIQRRSRSRTPRISRLKSPCLSSSNSPLSWHSPRDSPYRPSPRRPSPRSRSPRSPAMRSRSPHRSPWSTPRNSPKLSPRRRRSPAKESSRNTRGWSSTPENRSPESSKPKTKSSSDKEPVQANANPMFEARRRKFESTRPIDPTIDNKKIKLSKKEDENNIGIIEESSDDNSPKEKARETEDEELRLHDNYDFVEDGQQEDELIVDAASTKTEQPKKKKKDKEIYQVSKIKSELPLSERIFKEKKCKKHRDSTPDSSKDDDVDSITQDILDEETDLRTELSRRRAERLNRNVPIQSARLLQSAFKGVVNEAVKNNAKTQKNIAKVDDKSNQKEVRRVTVLRSVVSDFHDSEDETADSKVPVRFRLGLNKSSQDHRESKNPRKSSKRQTRKVKQESFVNGRN